MAKYDMVIVKIHENWNAVIVDENKNLHIQKNNQNHNDVHQVIYHNLKKIQNDIVYKINCDINLDKNEHHCNIEGIWNILSDIQIHSKLLRIHIVHIIHILLILILSILTWINVILQVISDKNNLNSFQIIIFLSINLVFFFFLILGLLFWYSVSIIYLDNWLSVCKPDIDIFWNSLIQSEKFFEKYFKYEGYYWLSIIIRHFSFTKIYRFYFSLCKIIYII